MENINNTTVTDDVIVNQEGEPQRQLTPEEQEAINAYRESQKSREEKEEGLPEGYNEDGTPKEDLIAGKFKSQEELVKAYEELQKKLGNPESKTEDSPEDTKEEPEKTEVTNDKGEVIDVTKYGQEYAQNGKISDESYAELEKKGFSKETVNQYIRGQQALVQVFSQSVYDAVGGQEEYSKIIEWTRENGDKKVAEAYDSALQTLNTEDAIRNLEFLAMKYNQASPSTPKRMEGDAGGQGLAPFADKNEWQKAQTHRLYGKDAKYTHMVDKRYLMSRKKGLI